MSHWIYMTLECLCLSQLGDVALLLHPFRKPSVGLHTVSTLKEIAGVTLFSPGLQNWYFRYKQILLKMQRPFSAKLLLVKLIKNSSTWICKISQATWICILWIKSFLEKKRLHIALEYISKLKKNCGGRVSNGTEMKFDEHILFLSLFPCPQHLKAAGHCDNTDS